MDFVSVTDIDLTIESVITNCIWSSLKMCQSDGWKMSTNDVAFDIVVYKSYDLTFIVLINISNFW